MFLMPLMLLCEFHSTSQHESGRTQQSPNQAVLYPEKQAHSPKEKYNTYQSGIYEVEAYLTAPTETVSEE
jgi:hypothetical protein